MATKKILMKAAAAKIDLPGLIKKLTANTDASRMQKVTKMLRADRFQLFAEVTDDHLTGVVKSQTDGDLVYACRLSKSGEFFCCTQNLKHCGGLRGALCKHLLVLIDRPGAVGRARPGAGARVEPQQQEPQAHARLRRGHRHLRPLQGRAGGRDGLAPDRDHP